jgi:hypothetical protein
MSPLHVYPKDVGNPTKQTLLCVVVIAASAPSAPVSIPRFEDYPVTEVWHGTPAPVRLIKPAERMFRTRLTNAAKKPANFAGHYRFTLWGCGSECISGAIIDLDTGKVFSPPLAKGDVGVMYFNVCQSAYENSGVDFHVNSRLLVLRCGLNYSERLQTNVPDAYYFVWEGERFNQILRVPGERR